MPYSLTCLQLIFNAQLVTQLVAQLATSTICGSRNVGFILKQVYVNTF